MPNSQTTAELLKDAQEALFEAAFRTDDYTAAYALLEKALGRAAAEGDRTAEGDALYYAGLTRHYDSIGKLMSGLPVVEADVEREDELFHRSLDAHQESGQSAGRARALFGLGLVAQVLRRNWDAAMPYYREALGLVGALENAGDIYSASEIHRDIGFFYLVHDVKPDEAVRHLSHSLELRELLGDPRRVPSGLVALGRAELAAGHSERAVDLLGRAVEAARRVGLTPKRVEDAEAALREAVVAAGR
jgi:tetratricopeptide (TPR) repeat protein